MNSQEVYKVDLEFNTDGDFVIKGYEEYSNYGIVHIRKYFALDKTNEMFLFLEDIISRVYAKRSYVKEEIKERLERLIEKAKKEQKDPETFYVSEYIGGNRSCEFSIDLYEKNYFEKDIRYTVASLEKKLKELNKELKQLEEIQGQYYEYISKNRNFI